LAESSGLPVHNLPGSRAVFAFQEELDLWITGEDPVLPKTDGRISSSGQHIILPVESRSKKIDPGVPDGTDEATPQGRPGVRSVAIVTTTLLAVLVLLAVGPRFRSASDWRNQGTPLTGEWTFADAGVEGTSQSIGRFETTHIFGPGASATVNLQSEGTRWSGGLEIFEDDLHWTFVSLSPRQREVMVYRFPAGTVNSLFAGYDVSPNEAIQLTVAVSKNMLNISCGSCLEVEIPLSRGDVSAGRLLLRVGSAGDEIHEPSGGRCRFSDLEVHGSPTVLPVNRVEEVPTAERPSAIYTLMVDNVDDQIDILLDGRRLASAGYRETIGPLMLNPFLNLGRHTLTARLFNRKWTAAFGIVLEENETKVWEERCGDVHQVKSGCGEIGNRLGMVKELSFSFEAH
jgi:hypothetical protein